VATVQSKHIVHNYVQKPRIIEQTLFGRGQTPSGMRHLFATVKQAKPYGVPGHFTIFLYLICALNTAELEPVEDVSEEEEHLHPSQALAQAPPFA